jgi:hypothetical protein
MPQYITFILFCLGQSQQNAEVPKQSQAAATTKEGDEVKSGSQTSIPVCGASTNGSTGMLIIY